MHIQSLFIAVVIFCGTVSACTISGEEDRFKISINGAEVLDTKTGLTWSRCPVYSSWDGSSCKPTYQVSSAGYLYQFGEQPDTTITGINPHEKAFLKAKDIEGWRIPNIKELSSLRSNSICNETISSGPTSWVVSYFVDVKAFPFVSTLARAPVFQSNAFIMSTTPAIGRPDLYYSMNFFTKTPSQSQPIVLPQSRGARNSILLLIKD